ncbi:hypothetical protein V6N13_123961 [Hibiscus sabdariffa]
MVNLIDFPALSQFSHRASVSKPSPSDNQSTILDKTKHSATIMKENDYPNIVDKSTMVPDLNAESFSCPPLGDSLDPSKLLDNGIEDLQPAAPLSHGSIDMVDEKSHSPRGSREVAMIE